MGYFVSDVVTPHPYIRVTDMHPGRVDMREVKYVPEAAFPPIRNYRIYKDDLFISVAGTLGIVGKIPDALDGANLTENANRISAIECDRDFLLHVMLSPVVQNFIESERTVGAQPKLALARIRKFSIPLPPSDIEQSAIATALGDMDVLLAAQDALIAKKRAIKQGAIQELLTGKRRLPGFSGEWEECALGEIATFHKGKGLPKSDLSDDGPNQCIHYGELFTQYGYSIHETISRTWASGDFRSVENDVLMPTSDVTPRGLAKASCVVINDVVIGGDILVIRTDPSSVSGTFLSHVIRHEEEQVLRLVTGTTVFHLYGADMKKFVFKLPSIFEQRAIVEALCDMDAELTALEAQRAKTAQLKQGMMQALLTGRIRLV